MDDYGNFNLGPQVSDMWGVIRSARKIIVKINNNMPQAMGHQTQINLYKVDHVVEGSNTSLPEVTQKAPTKIERKIAAHVIERTH